MLRLTLCVLLVAAAYGTQECYVPETLPGQELCGTRYCNPEAEVCVDGVCQCETGLGQPELICSADTDDFASILSDPQAWTVNKRQSGYLPVPCMYQFQHVKTKTQTSENGNCEIKVMVYHKRVKGKMYVGGFEVHIKAKQLALANGVQNMVYKADGWSDGHQYCFHYRASKNGGNSYGEDVNLRKFKVDYAPYTFEIHKPTNRMNLQVPTCGLHLQFRPANESLTVQEQVYLPGLGMKIDLSKEPTYKSKNSVVSLPPDRTIPESRVNTDVMTHLAFTGAGNSYSDYDYYSDQCPVAKAALDKCSTNADVDQATKKCRFILDKSLFVNCYSNSGTNPDPPGQVNRMLALYSACIDSFCHSSHAIREARCINMRDSFDELDTACRALVPVLSGFACTF